MPQVRLILALHNHQPVGNFESVYDEAFQTSYRPFLDVLERYAEIRFALHTSGPLLGWLVDHHPEYVDRLRALVACGRVEILGGGYYEPILTMIPHRDRVGQIRAFSSYLNELFSTQVRGMWLAERVWEQSLVTAITASGIEYTVLDDFHFQRAVGSEEDVSGYYLTEEEGALLKVFPAAGPLRYTMPFQEPHATYEFLRRQAEKEPGSTVVFADDGEKFGCWTQTFEHVYINGWLSRFCDMLAANRDWLQTTTFAQAVDTTVPAGKIFLSDGSYREMTEWALPSESLLAFQKGAEHLALLPDAGLIRRFYRAGGNWRNFKARYPESDEMYARMLGVSRRLAAAEIDPKSDPDYLEIARQELYRGQCNCPYWHGSFGGLYLPHLRNAIYGALIASDNALDDAEGKSGPRAVIEVGDLNLDGRQEARLENDRLIALVRPAQGGHIYELDVRETGTNLLATLDRRPEAYHGKVVEAARRLRNRRSGEEDHARSSETVVLKEPELDRQLVYDRHPRKALVDHFYPVDVTLESLTACLDIELGDFATGTYLSKIRRDPDRVAIVMERPGRAGEHAIRIKKTIELAAGEPCLAIHYELAQLPADACLHFAVELNVAAMAGHVPDRYYLDAAGANLGMLDCTLDLPHARGVTMVDEFLNLAVDLSWSQSAGLWCMPVETVSHSEGGVEGVYQSSAVIPHWHVTAAAEGRWEVWIRWSINRAASSSGTARGRGVLAGVASS
jgi:alpha-amylase